MLTALEIMPILKIDRLDDKIETSRRFLGEFLGRTARILGPDREEVRTDMEIVLGGWAAGGQYGMNVVGRRMRNVISHTEDIISRELQQRTVYKREPSVEEIATKLPTADLVASSKLYLLGWIHNEHEQACILNEFFTKRAARGFPLKYIKASLPVEYMKLYAGRGAYVGLAVAGVIYAYNLFERITEANNATSPTTS